MGGFIVTIIILLVGTIFRVELVRFLSVILQEKDEKLFGDGEETITKRLYQSLPVWYLFLIYVVMNYDNRMLMVICSLFVYLLKKDYVKKRKRYRKELEQIRFQFPIWLRQIQILLQTNTVASALQLSYRQAPELMKHDLEQFMMELNQDAIALEPYLHFLSRYHLADIERAMKLLFRYQSVGKQDCMQQLNRMIQTTTRWLRKQRQKRNEEEIAMYQWWGMLPLFGVTVVFMAIMFELMIALFGKGVV